MNKFAKLATACTVLLLNSLLSCAVHAEELTSVCWMTEQQSLVRFSVTQTGVNHYIYTGIFNENDGEASASYAITGAVEVGPDGKLGGSFSGSKATTASFKTFIAALVIDPVTFGGTVELIRNKYDRNTSNTNTEYRLHTLTKANCPPK